MDAKGALEALGRVLESLSYQKVLQRGFAVVHGPGGLITRAGQVSKGLAVELEFADGRARATGAGGAAAPRGKGRRTPGRSSGGDPQGSLL